MTEIERYARRIENNFFASFDNLQEAYDYVGKIALQVDHPAAVLTAVHMLMNTVAAELRSLEDDAPNDPVALGEIFNV